MTAENFPPLGKDTNPCQTCRNKNTQWHSSYSGKRITFKETNLGHDTFRIFPHTLRNFPWFPCQFLHTGPNISKRPTMPCLILLRSHGPFSKLCSMVFFHFLGSLLYLLLAGGLAMTCPLRESLPTFPHLHLANSFSSWRTPMKWSFLGKYSGHLLDFVFVLFVCFTVQHLTSTSYSRGFLWTIPFVW